MALSELLLGSGVGLFIALLGWSNQIKDFQSETKRLQQLFSQKLGTKYSDVNRITSKLDAKKVNSDFIETIRSIKKIIEKDKKNAGKNLTELNNLSDIDKKYEEIKELYYKKYELTLELTGIAFLTGILAFGFEAINSVNLTWIFLSLLATVPLIWLRRSLLLLIKINKEEKKFQDMIKVSDRDLEK